MLARPGGHSQLISSGDRKSTRLNSSHLVISYAVFCLKKKNDIESKLPAQEGAIDHSPTHQAYNMPPHLLDHLCIERRPRGQLYELRVLPVRRTSQPL